PEVSPPDETACPVTLARLLAVHERLEHHGLRAFPLAVLVPIVGDAGVCAAARTGQHEQPTMTCDEIAERSRHRLIFSRYALPAVPFDRRSTKPNRSTSVQRSKSPSGAHVAAGSKNIFAAGDSRSVSRTPL